MNMLPKLKPLLSTITRIKDAGQLKKYIDFIAFPYYRNLTPDTRIEFTFPLTIFIGQNGCGKSSALHALYGAVSGKTPTHFWFETKVDPVKYYDDKRRRHSFWYGFKDKNGSAKQVVKARIQRVGDPNYWETSRPLAWAGMIPSLTRTPPIVKKVLYLDFRSELSAFDQFFYFGDLKGSVAKNKQEFIRHQSVRLWKVLSGEKSVYRTKKGFQNEPMESLSTSELKWISFILGRNYAAGKILKHRFFRNQGYSVFFETNFAGYSEAVAGSGEMAVVRLIKEILNAEPFSLILLDEPETSLHPGAQERLKIFLLEQIKTKKHQVIISSHSPSIIRGLPKSAIKVFHQNPKDGRFLVKQEVIPDEAFYHLEAPSENQKRIIVEDFVAKEIIDAVVGTMGPARANLLMVTFNPGGSGVIKKEFISVFCRSGTQSEFVFLDGDEKNGDNHLDWRTIPTNQLSIARLKQEIVAQTGVEIKFSVDGSGEHADEQQLELLKKYLDFYLTKVFYLPGNIPEEIIWDSDRAQKLIRMANEPLQSIESKIDELTRETNFKKKFALLSSFLASDDSAQSIRVYHKQFITSWIQLRNSQFEAIKRNLEPILNS